MGPCPIPRATHKKTAKLKKALSFYGSEKTIHITYYITETLLQPLYDQNDQNWALFQQTYLSSQADVCPDTSQNRLIVVSFNPYLCRNMV